MRSEDFQDILTVVSHYVHVVDHRRWDDLHEVYTDDAVLDLRGVGLDTYRGRHEIIAQLSNVDAGLPGALMTSNVTLSQGDDVDSAEGRSRWLSAKTTGFAFGTYDDEYRRTEVGWRISRRASSRVLTTSLT